MLDQPQLRQKTPEKYAVAFSLFMIPAIIFWHSQQNILLFITGALLGTFGEYLCMKLGFWHYHTPFFKSIGLPISLPLAWGLSSVIIGNLAIIRIGKDEDSGVPR